MPNKVPPTLTLLYAQRLRDTHVPPGMDHQVYLQGSYANSTNIRGDSDVDIVVETQNVFYHNVPLHLLQQYGIEPGAYRWPQFRAEVLQALREYYGTDSVTDGNKAIRVLGNDSRLNADVVPCAEYRHYHGIHYAEGISGRATACRSSIFPNAIARTARERTKSAPCATSPTSAS